MITEDRENYTLTANMMYISTSKNIAATIYNTINFIFKMEYRRAVPRHRIHTFRTNITAVAVGSLLQCIGTGVGKRTNVTAVAVVKLLQCSGTRGGIRIDRIFIS